MTFRDPQGGASKATLDVDRLSELARTALSEGNEDAALLQLRSAAERASSARLWQWTALLHRAIDEHEHALDAFARAARLAPSDPGIAHGYAHTALEAGVDAIVLFETARQLHPTKSEILIGLAAAKLAQGRGEEAAAELGRILDEVPLWLAGHAQHSQLVSVLGRPQDATRSLKRALRSVPGSTDLWRSLFDLHTRREDFAALQESVAEATEAEAAIALRHEYGAIAASELGQTGHADILFNALSSETASKLAVWRVRHHLRTGRIKEALMLIEVELQTDRAASIWPYAATAWRIAHDPRIVWLERDLSLVSTIDLRSKLPDFQAIANVLDSLHTAKGQYLDQSVRGGTQTDGPLFSRIEPEIRALRSAIVQAVERYVKELPSPDPTHPLLSSRRDRRIRFAGSWSVRLQGLGYHTSHVHPYGWISSAFYLSLPSQRGDDPHAGWLTMGQPPASLGLDLSPVRMIKPRIGTLVLFPSWLWHGTKPFSAGVRLTAAFDVAHPLQAEFSAHRKSVVVAKNK